MSKVKVEDCIANPLRHVKNPRVNVLGKLFWKAIYYYDIGLKSWNGLVRNYTFNKHLVEQTNVKRSDAKSNLYMAIVSDNPTFNMIIRAFRVIDVRRIEFTVRLYRGPNMSEVVIEEAYDIHRIPDTEEPIDVDDDILEEDQDD